MIHTGDCIEVMRGMEADSVDAVVTDPPYALTSIGRTLQMSGESLDPRGSIRSNQRRTAGGFMGRNWDAPDDGTPRGFQAWCQQWGTEALRVTKPGGYLLAFGGTRTHHRLVCGLEDAGWIIRDELTWVYACLSDDTEVLTDQGWVQYNRASEATHAAAFDTATGKLRWERIEAVHQYDHEGPMAAVGPSLTTLNHRVILSSESEVPLPRHAELRRLWGELRDVGSVPGDASQDMLAGVPVGQALRVPQGQGEAAVGAQRTLVRMRGMRQADVEAGRMGEAHYRADVLAGMQRGSSATVTDIPTWDAGGLDRGELGELPPEDERPEQPSLEGRRYRVQEAWELFGSAVRESAGVGAPDGPQGRLHHGASATDGRPVRLPDDQDGSGQSREPQPDRQSSWEPDALAGQSVAQAVRMEQMHPRYGLPADAPRLVDYAGVVWCITVPSGAFVARRNGVAFVTGNSGFPKGRANLKPAHEPIVLARKPGPLRPLGIDECRIGPPMTEVEIARSGKSTNGAIYGDLDPVDWKRDGVTPQGRWPSNLLLSDPALFDEPNPYVVGSGATSTDGVAVNHRREGDKPGQVFGVFAAPQEDAGYGGEGGYSRFFLVPKSSRADREPVVRGQVEAQTIALNSNGKPSEFMGQKSCGKCGEKWIAADGWPRCGHGKENTIRSPQTIPRENAHPTVKPVSLMRHLVRLITPSGGTVLDPFAGSGSTLIAAELEGFPWIGIEQSAEYVAIAEARLNGTQRGLGLDTPLVGEPRKSVDGVAVRHRGVAATDNVYGGSVGYHPVGTPDLTYRRPKPEGPAKPSADTVPVWSDREPAV